MEAVTQWEYSVADAQAGQHNDTLQRYRHSVIDPALDALDLRLKELSSNPNPAVRSFAAHDHAVLIDETVKVFCLAVQSIWERQLREYLKTCPNVPALCATNSKLGKAIEKALWGAELNQVFQQIRELSLEEFDSYPLLTLLQLIGNACRHGDGSSSRQLYKKHPELWHMPAVIVDTKTGNANPPARLMRIPRDLLNRLVDAVCLFWLDMEHHALLGIVNSNPQIIDYLNSLESTRAELRHTLASPRTGVDETGF
jgi:hypothetical protein